MNGYSRIVQLWTDKQLQEKYKELEQVAKYSNPAQDVFWLYQAIIEELKNRNLQ